MEAYFEQHFQAFLPNESDDKKTVTVSTEVYLRKILQRDPQLQKGVQLVIQGDGAGLSRTKNQVTFALKVLPSLEHRGTRAVRVGVEEEHTFSVLIFDGGEKRAQLDIALERLVLECRRIHKAGGIMLHDHLPPEFIGPRQMVKVSFAVTVDKKLLDILLALAGTSSFYPCDGCLCKDESLHDATKMQDRTLENAFLLAHLPYPGMSSSLFPWTCECCNKVFQTPEEMEEETLSTKKAARDHWQTHFSQRWHQGPSFDFVPYSHYITDILHYLLRSIDVLWRHTICPYLITDDIADTFATKVTQLTGCMVKTVKVEKGEGKAASKQCSFIGREAQLLLIYHRDVIKTLIGENDSKLDPTLKLWRQFEVLWETLCEPWQDYTIETRQQRASRVKDHARDFVWQFMDTVSAEATTIYIHVGLHHLPTQILQHGDLWDYSCERLESLHADKKKAHLNCTNKKAGEMRQLMKVECNLFDLKEDVPMRNYSRKVANKKYTDMQLQQKKLEQVEK